MITSLLILATPTFPKFLSAQYEAIRCSGVDSTLDLFISPRLTVCTGWAHCEGPRRVTVSTHGAFRPYRCCAGGSLWATITRLASQTHRCATATVISNFAWLWIDRGIATGVARGAGCATCRGNGTVAVQDRAVEWERRGRSHSGSISCGEP